MTDSPATGTMRVVRVHDAQTIRIEDAPIPNIGPEEALVAVRACGICSGDVTPWYIEQKAPLVVGHEPAGEVVSVGSEVTQFAPGDRVFVHHHAPCLTCRQCQKGAHSMCETWRKSRIDPGGMAEYVRVPSGNLNHDTLRLPDGVSFEAGALVEPIACTVKALRRARFEPGQSVLVIGLGIMGQLLVRLARHEGAGVILAADRVVYRLARAQAGGADRVIDVDSEDLPTIVSETTGGEMADLVIVGPGNREAIRSGLACAGRASTILLFMSTPPGVETALELHDLFFNEKDLICSYSCGPEDTRRALELLEEKVFVTDDLITHRFPLEQAEEAFCLAARAGDSLKVMIRIGPLPPEVSP